MKTTIRIAAFLAGTLAALTAHADRDRDREIEGVVQSINAAERSFVVEGVTIHVDDRTDYDDEYRRFEDIEEGHRVEVDYMVRDGRNVAVEIEIDD